MLSLFRHEVAEQHHLAYRGEILVVRPLSLRVTALFAAVFIAAAGLYLLCGEYTQKAHVVGYLVPASGFDRVASTASGTIKKRMVTDGQQVRQGDGLLIVAVDRVSTSGGETQATVGEQLRHRLDSLDDELSKQRAFFRERHAALDQRIREYEDELQQLDREADTQRERVSLASNVEKKFRGLSSSGLIPAIQVDEKKDEALSQKARLEELARSRLSLRRELNAARADANELPMQEKSRIAGIERDMAVIKQDIAENEAHREIAITAPRDGVVNTLMVDVGQAVTVNQPLLTILPVDMNLEVQLFAPSRSIGFIKPGQAVALRYQAFPYQKFGRRQGRVVQVAQVPMQPSELPLPLPNAGEALYRITVEPDSQAIAAFGNPAALQPGMMVDADILLYRRRLIEWLFEPLFKLSSPT